MTTLPLRPIPVRLIVVPVLVAALGFICWLIIRTAVGASFMTYVQRAANLELESQVKGAEIARKYAPEDPLVRYGTGGVFFNVASSEFNETMLNDAVNELRLSTQLSPLDYRMWLALGRALDRRGEGAEARRAFEEAIRLAPNHFEPHWALGNYLLRNGDSTGAFNEMREALKSRPSSLTLIFDYAWQAFHGDGKAMARVLEPPESIRAQFVSFLIDRGKAKDALDIWRENRFNENAHPDSVRTVAESLIKNDQLADAYAVWFEAKQTEHPEPDSGSLLSNGDFERPITLNSVTPFLMWKITQQRDVTNSLDNQIKQTGNYAFRSGFHVRENTGVLFVSQTVAVKRSTSYHLKFAARSRELENLTNPQLVVTDAGKAERLTFTLPQLPNGDTDWQYYRLDFTTTPMTDAITVTVHRPGCSDPPCPFTGRLWLDDFKLVEKR
jgi:Flp pilus assembly protein TadD